MRCCIGIDEAGSGPMLGPLSVISCSLEAVNHEAVAAAFATADIFVADSKEVHKSGSIGPLEQVALPALAWFSGMMPQTAAEAFSLVGEQPEHWTRVPWYAEAAKLTLPLAEPVHDWQCDLTPVGVSGALIQPWDINDGASKGKNKAELQWQVIADSLKQITHHEQSLVCDRLGGRRYYADLLQAVWPDHMVTVRSEERGGSRYDAIDQNGLLHDAAFLVKGEQHSPLVAAASCIAKYLRELQMHLLNRYWSGRFRWLKPTAGYPQDAKRWIYQLGTGNVGAYGYDLIRGYQSEEDA